ncbi:Receptor-like protein [Drosera capensis]
MTRNFQTMIGKGGFGTVYHGSPEDGTQVAVKELNELSAIGCKLFQTVASCKVPFTISLAEDVGYCDQGVTMALVYEYMANGNLQEHLSGAELAPATKAICVDILPRFLMFIVLGLEFHSSLRCLEYLHYGSKPPIIHRDLKASNILDSKLHAKIGDFGLSRILSNESKSHVSTDVAGTYGYMDPDYYKLHKLNEKIDVYSFGVVLLELITGRAAVVEDVEVVHLVDWVRPNVDGGNINDIMDRRLQGSWSVNSEWKALEIAMECVPSSAAVRLTMSQVVVDLKECLDSQLADERGDKLLSLMPPDMIFDVAAVDTELAMGPEARNKKLIQQIQLWIFAVCKQLK